MIKESLKSPPAIGKVDTLPPDLETVKPRPFTLHQRKSSAVEGVNSTL
jgi:hypothetical protein